MMMSSSIPDQQVGPQATTGSFPSSKRSAGDAGRLDADTLGEIVERLSQPHVSPRRTIRSSVRHAVLAPALVWRALRSESAEPVRAQLVNLSQGGVGLLAGRPFEVGEPFLFEMTLEGIGHVQWQCLVRWCIPTDDGIQRIGAVFTDTQVGEGGRS